MSSLMHKPTGPILDAQPGNLRRAATANPAFRPEFVRSVKMHPVLAGSVAALMLLVLVALSMRQKAAYSAEALVYIEPFSSKVLNDGSAANFDSTKYESSLAQQMLTAQRVDILQTALGTLPRQVWAAYGATAQSAASVLQSQLKVQRVSTSYQISISLKGPDAVNTAAIVNAVTTAYLEAGRKDEISQADQRSQLLSEERGRIEQELAKTRAEQTQLGATLGVADPGAEGAANPFDSQLDALRSQLVQARASHDQAAAQLAAISGVSGSHTSGLTAAANDVIGGDPGLGSMKATINQRRAQLSSQMAGLTPGNPIYKQDQDELTDLDKTLDSMTVQLRDRAARSLQDKLRTDLERTSDVEARINGELARQTANATSASPRLQRAAELAADVQRLTARYAIVDNALHSLELETTGPGMAHLALAAAVPGSPEPNKKRLILLAAVPLALLCGLGAAVFARKRDRRVYTGGDVDDVLGFAPIAILPARAEVSADVLEEYSLRLAAGVEGAYRGGNARTFVITPVSAETNVTPLVEALDRKLGELGLGVAILEAARVFEQHEQPAARAGMGGSDAAYDRRFEGLAATLFGRMKSEHDVILIDAPALLISGQTEYVARCADVTLLIAESAVTTRGELYQAGVLLQRLNVTGVGSVLEELRIRDADGAFVKGIRALEGRTRRVGRPRPAMAVTPAVPQVQPAPEPVFAGAVEVQPMTVDEPVAQAEETSAEISAERPEQAWYPVHAVVAATETHAGPLAEPVPAEPFAPEPGARSESTAELPPQPADPVEVEHPAPMALFESTEPAPERRRMSSQSGSSRSSGNEYGNEEASPARSWFQRIFQREPEPVVSILPDGEDEDDETPETPAVALAARVRDASRDDLPLREGHGTEPEGTVLSEPPHDAQAELAMATPVASRAVAAAPLVAAPEPADVKKPVAVLESSMNLSSLSVEEPPVLPLPLFSPAAEPPAVPAGPTPGAVWPKPVAFVPTASQPAASLESTVYAFQAHAVAASAQVPAPGALPASMSGIKPAASPARPLPPVRSAPARPLSFLELSQLQTAAAVMQPEPAPVQHSEAATEPEHVWSPALAESPEPVYAPAPEEVAPLPPEAPAEAVLQQHFEEAAEPEREAAVEPFFPRESAAGPAAEEWNPAPLNRWDPIPPLRSQQEPWHNSGSRRVAQSDPKGIWDGEATVRIPPSDRWVPAESLPVDAPPAEANDVVLTRRWGLLSRFQQGESFQAGRRAAAPSANPTRQPEPEEPYVQDYGQGDDSQLNPEYDRRRR